MRRIRFHGRPYLLIGERWGAITTPEALHAGEHPFALLDQDGQVWRDGALIGDAADVEFEDAEAG